MKRIITLAIAVIACVGMTRAWTPSDTDYQIVDMDSVYDQAGMKSFILDDGTIYHLWQRTPQGMMYDEPEYGFYLHMQIFDPAGNAKLDKEGVLVSAQPTDSWFTDYGAVIADNGDIVIAYYDTRDDESSTNSHIRLYRYDKDGNAVWDADGVPVPATTINETAFNSYENAPQLIKSDDNLYLSFSHVEQYNVKADSTNWEPSWWDPDEEMPDSIQLSYYDYRLMCVNNDGTMAWDECKVLDSKSIDMIAPCKDGDFYLLYSNEGAGFDARRINREGNDVWDEPATVEGESLSAGSYTTAPTVLTDEDGGLVLVYRKLMSWSGYVCTNHLTADGTAYETGVSLTGSTDGDCGTWEAELNGDSLLVAWQYKVTEYNMYANCVNINDNASFLWPEWPIDNSKGVSYDTNTEWGMKPVKVIRQSDGWVLLYGNGQSWSGANFMVLKIDDNGNKVWSKQICEDNFKCDGYSVVSDGKYAYIFLTVEQEYGDNWEQVVGDGGMRVMCVDITSNPDAIYEVAVDANGVETRYDLTGRVVPNDHKGLQIIKCADGTVKKVMVK